MARLVADKGFFLVGLGLKISANLQPLEASH